MLNKYDKGYTKEKILLQLTEEELDYLRLILKTSYTHYIHDLVVSGDEIVIDNSFEDKFMEDLIKENIPYKKDKLLLLQGLFNVIGY